jgi:heptosyltransferase-2
LMPEKILVRATNWVGDLVMSTPALAGIRKNFPAAEICVLVRPPLDELLKANPSVDEVILYDKKGVHAGPGGMARLIGELRRKKFSRAILLQNAFEAALIAFLAKIPERMGYGTDSRGVLLTRAVKVAPETRKKHQVYYYLDLLAALGLKAGDAHPKLYLEKEDKDYARKLLRENGISQGSLVVGINPGAQYGIAKKWHPERFGYVADHLVREFGAKVIIFGGPGDITTAKTVQASMREGALNLAGKTSIRGLMALVKRCDIFITNDTGPMHVAAALDVPTLAIFGSTDPTATGPFGKLGCVVREPVNCSPCLNRKCPGKHYHCMERVSAERVFKAAKEMLEKHS